MQAAAARDDDARLRRRTWIAAAVLVALVAVFATYYYYDRYATPAGVVETPDPIEQLENQVRAKPGDVQLRLSLAENYLLNRRYDDAIKTAGDVLEVAPKQDRAMLILGVAYSLNDQAEQALKPLDKFIAMHEKAQTAAFDTSLEAALFYKGQDLLALDRPKEAVKPLEQAVGISPTDADALHMLGAALAATDRHKDAIAVFSRAVALVPDFREVYEGMAGSYDASGQQVLGDYARAMVAFSDEQYESARDQLVAVVAAKKAFTPAHLGLGLAFEQLGDLTEAERSLKTAIKQDPTSIAVQQALGRVQATIQQEGGQ